MGDEQRSLEVRGDYPEAVLHLLAECRADAGQFLPEPTEQAAEIAITLVSVGDHAEEAADLLERLRLIVAEGRVKRAVHSLHVKVDRLQAEVFLALEEVSDVAPVGGLTTLNFLGLSENQIVDVSPLSSLTNLHSLDLNGNKIIDIAPLSSLTRLSTLSLYENQIVDIRWEA